MEAITHVFNMIFDTVEGILKFIFELIESLFNKRKEEYTADFASQWSVMTSYNYGFCLTGKKNLTVKDSYQNAIVIGGTGTGKSSVVLIPSLFTTCGSKVINDPSGELYAKSAGYLRKKGYEVKVLNFTDPLNSSGYNPLIRAQSSSDIQKVASMLIQNTLGGSGKDPFWNLQAVSLLTMIISILKKQSLEYQNLFNVRQLLSQLGGSPELIDSLFSKYADNILFAEYKSFIAYDSKVVSGVIATCKAALQIFNDEAVAKVTSFDNLDLMEFREKPVALFIRNSVADQKYYNVLTSLFFEQFFSFIMSRFPNDNEQDIFLLVDEASSLNLPSLPMAVANVRKHRAGIMLLLQDYNQLIHLYGKYEADGIKANCYAKMYFTGQSLETATELERTLGKFEFKDKEGHKVIRSLMTSDEIRMLDMNRAILICGHNPPVMARLRPYYESLKFNEYASCPAPEIENQAFSGSIPVLPIIPSSEQKDG
jgi:type IV secretion system protein VirD4